MNVRRKARCIMKNRKERGNCMKNHKGFTLVELLVGMAILSVVAAAITGFIVSGSKSYAAANTEIVVQQEAQLAMNQISDVVIDTTRSVNYTGYAADGSAQQVVKDADFTIVVEDKSLTLFNGTGTVVLDAGGNPVFDADGNPEIAKDADGKPIIDGGNGNQFNYQFYYDKSEEKLYYSQIALNEEDFPEAERVLLAEYVKDFSADLSQVEEKRVVQLTVSYEYNNRIYDTSNNITIRNKVLVNSVNLAVDKTVELSVRPKENMVVLEPGEHYYKFSTPRVEGRNITDKSVTWSISAEEQSKLTGADTGFTDAANGIIHISRDEKVKSFEVTVTTNAVNSEGNHAEAKVIVYVKRVTSVALNKSEDSDLSNGAKEISAGSTITVSAHAEGNKLGVACSNCGDDISIDKYVVENENIWKWTIVKDDNNICTMTSGGHEAAVFTISSEAKPGNQVILEATSLLSTTSNAYGRDYDRVFGRITLTVANHKKNISLGGDIRYGYATKVNIDNADFNKGGQGYYIVCARIKTDPDAPASSDMVMLYGTNGADTWLTPDVFGLNMDKTYYISIQLLDQGGHLSGKDDPRVTDVVAEYNGNIDSTGTYIGTKYPASDKISFTLHSPQIVYNYNGELYKGNEVSIDPIYAAAGGKTVSCPVVEVTNARPETMDQVYFEVYKGEGNDPSNWTRIYGRTPGENGNTGNSRAGALDFSSIDNRKNLEIKLEGNNNPGPDTLGTYHYVPYIAYQNSPTADHGYVKYWANYSYSDEYYRTEYYKRPNSTVHFTVKGGGNLKLWANTDANNNNFVKGEIYFPTPSDWSFRNYFSLNNPEIQIIKSSNNWFRIFESDGRTDRGVSISKMTCEYIPTEDSYVIELFYECTEQLQNNKIEVSAGKFKCSAKGTEWSQKDIGTQDAELERGNTAVISNGNARIKIGNKEYQAYIALPTEPKFVNWWNGNYGFNLDEIKKANGSDVNANTIQYASISYITTDDKGFKCVKTIQCSKATCSYAINNKTYTLKVWCKDDGGNEISVGEFTCKEGENAWNYVPTLIK